MENSPQKEIQKIHERNKKVEADKAWETSWFRIIIVTGTIYFVAALLMLTVNVENPWLNALIPAGGYFLSEQSFPFIKHWWIKNFYNNKV